MRKTITIESTLFGNPSNPVADSTNSQPLPVTIPAAEEKVSVPEEDIMANIVDVSRLTLGGLDSYVAMHGDDVTLASCVNALMNQVDNPVRSIGGHNS